MKNKQFSPYSLALNIGYMIVTPILVFGIGGVLLDKYFQLFPIFTFIGFFLAMTSGLTIVYKKSKDMIEDINSQNPPKPKTK
jgi:F0F1-type ATP synthase assembly protein I